MNKVINPVEITITYIGSCLLSASIHTNGVWQLVYLDEYLNLS